MFCFSGVGIRGEIDHSFAGEHFALIFAGSEFLVFIRKIIFIFEFQGFDFELEESLFALFAHHFLGEGPVARHGGNRAPGPAQTKNHRDNQNHVIEHEQIVLEPILELSGLSLQLAHVKIITQKSGSLPA